MRKMLTYMEEKYGESFSPLGPFNGQFGKEYVMLEVKSQTGPQEGILVRRIPTKGQECYQDNYLAFILKEDLEKRIKEAAEQTLGKCRVNYRVPELVFPADFSTDMTAEEFLVNPLSMVKVVIEPEEIRKDPEEMADAFLKSMKERGYCVGGAILFPDGQKAIFSIGEEGILKYLEWRRETWANGT